MVQYPARRAKNYRTAVRESAGGKRFRYADSAVDKDSWELKLTGLGANERQAIDAVFVAAEGRLRAFTFLDPFDNLLAYSGELILSAWFKDAGVLLVDGQVDAFGGTSAARITNPTNAARRVYQLIAAPAGYRYTLSAYAKWVGSGVLRLVLGGEVAPGVREFTSAGEWSRLEFSAQWSGNVEVVLAGFELPAMSEVVVCGAQLEPSAAATLYKATNARSGVRRCRFADDGLHWVADGPGLSSTRIVLTTI
ncbi:MAG: DUF2460 domain-containing protein [Candidatus Solibacter usitatus]|nr:DUF2460 domain-containing protein [Candidatus Solibacter usitatus]